MEKKGNEISKKFLYLLISICVILIIFTVTMFILFATRKERVVEEQENGGNLSLNYSSNSSGLSIYNAVPTSDSVAIKKLEVGQYFDFSVDISLDNATSIEYEIAAVKDTKNSNLSNDDIKIYLEKEKSGEYTKIFGPQSFSPLKSKSELGSPVGSMILAKSKSSKSITENYRLRMWVSDKSLQPSGNYSVEIVVNGKAK